MSSNNSRVLGDILEQAVQSALGVLKDEGKVILEFTLLRARKYPDFWVLDAKGRQWLIECKNLAIKHISEGSKKIEGAKYWLHNLAWVRFNTLFKEWNGHKFQLRAKSGVKSQASLNTATCQPLLVISHLLFDSEAYQALKQLFGDFIIILGHQFLGDDKDKLSLYEQLREMFTRGGQP